MIQFLPFLTDDIGRSLDTENEVVVTRSLPTPLGNSPEGWEKNAVQFTRNNEFRAMIKSYTTTLKFYLKGAKILRDAFYRKGMETVLFFIWLKLDQSFGGEMKYKGWYKGEPDFGTFKDQYDGVEINITEGGFYKELQAQKTVVQEIPFDNDAVSLYMDGLFLRTKTTYNVPAVQQNGSAFVGGNDLATIPATITIQDGKAYGLTYLSVNYEQISNDGADDTGFMVGSENWMIKNDGVFGITFPIAGHIDLRCLGNQDEALNGRSGLFLYLKSSISNTSFVIADHVGVDANTDYVFPFSFTITLAPGEKLFPFRLFTEINPGARAIIVEYQETSNFIASAVTRDPASVILAHKVFKLGNKLTKKISTSSDLISPLLEPDDNLLVTSGDAIRNMPGAVIKSTFSDWHKSVDAVKCIALEVVDNNPVIASRYDKFNKNSRIADLGECVNWTLDGADEYVYDGAEVGYPSKSADSNIDVNGRYSFNNGFTWKLNVTRRVVNPYQAKSAYYADPYDIELIRLNLGGKDTTSGPTDNSNFFIDAEPKTDISFTGTIHFYHTDNRIELDGDVSAITPFIIVGAKLLINGVTWTVKSIVDIDTLDIIVEVQEFVAVSSDITGTAAITNLYKLRRLPYTTINGIPDDGTVFNLELSPGRIFRNHYRWLRSSFDHLDGAKLIFQTTEKNSLLETIDAAGNVINEKADIPVATMGEKVYLPYYTSFEIKSPDNLLELMSGNSGGKFDYKMNGIPMDGFPIDIKTEETHLETQTYQLLMTANNDNLRLINR